MRLEKEVGYGVVLFFYFYSEPFNSFPSPRSRVTRHSPLTLLKSLKHSANSLERT